MLEILSLIVIVCIIILVRLYYQGKETLTGYSYTRKPIGFARGYTMVECKKGRRRYFRQGTKEDIAYLKKREALISNLKRSKVINDILPRN